MACGTGKVEIRLLLRDTDRLLCSTWHTSTNPDKAISFIKYLLPQYDNVNEYNLFAKVLIPLKVQVETVCYIIRYKDRVLRVGT